MLLYMYTNINRVMHTYAYRSDSGRCNTIMHAIFMCGKRRLCLKLACMFHHRRHCCFAATVILKAMQKQHTSTIQKMYYVLAVWVVLSSFLARVTHFPVKKERGKEKRMEKPILILFSLSTEQKHGKLSQTFRAAGDHRIITATPSIIPYYRCYPQTHIYTLV